MDINLIDLPYVIYACFVLYNFCEVNKEPINEEAVRMSFYYNHEFQPPTQANGHASGSNEAEGIRIRRILTQYFDP